MVSPREPLKASKSRGFSHLFGARRWRMRVGSAGKAGDRLSERAAMGRPVMGLVAALVELGGEVVLGEVHKGLDSILCSGGSLCLEGTAKAGRVACWGGGGVGT
jgi:hypothetical protein